MNHMASDFAATATRIRGWRTDVMHMLILLVISFLERTQAGFLPAACGFLSALL